ncbi:hypothetical protein CAPTEDRAFT_223579 [Capitella teleta]|uniref:Vacuolar protein sorting-associated protein 18 homolog n=1 Tax=Capitella teleta TaxID=283909 RepID=R7V2G8_CAPTE|nr:hypothetical protein CAPTEDRAFT_223579 [Capitella teleta]|eukprot:ELU13053.1 hypothetical protein CAPTEDRAFT_223579 [Capitella teleta]
MANLFDQYEQAATRKAPRTQAPGGPYPEPIGSGFITARLEDETPIFSKLRINFSPPDAITHLQVCNNYLVMAMSSNMMVGIWVIKISRSCRRLFIELEIPRAVDDRIRQVFLDPTGKHSIFSMQSGENYYLSRHSKKPKALSKLRGHQISAVGWNRQNASDTSTGEILIGTTKAVIIETEIVSSEDSRFFQSTLENYVKPLYTLGRDHNYPITGIEFEKMPSTSLTEYRYFIMATLPGRLYQFIGNIPTSTESPMFQHIFSCYENSIDSFIELPGNSAYSELRFYHPKLRALPTAFAWMTGPGIYYGHIDASEENSVTRNARLMRYPREDGEKEGTPLAIVLTEFHALILFQDRLKAMCVLNEQLIYDDPYTERFGKLVGMCKDPIRGTMWVYTSKGVFKYKVTRESRDVWQMYLDLHEFDLAKQYCQDNPAHMDKVLTKQAEHLFSMKQYIESAKIYAKTHHSFEEVCLKFIQLEQKDALKMFLLQKIASLKPQDKTQLTMLVMWVVELYLNQLGQLKEQGEEGSQKYEFLQDSFHKFLQAPRVKECANENRSIVFDLIASHGDVEDNIFFAMIMHDFKRVITHYIQHENYKEALNVLLSKQMDVDLFYRFSPVLMQKIPKETVDAWIGKRDQLDPKKLIPALVQNERGGTEMQDNGAIRYLEFCVQTLGTQDQAIHNYLLALYAKLQPDKLMKYLHLQGQEAEQVSYDLKYALHTCSESDHKRACVHIYSTMGLYEEAVDLALQVNVDLAKQNADKPEDDEDLRRKLWLKIAQHVVEKEKDIKRAMDFLNECDLLKIEDILPFFPDFVTIDHFKDAICTSLQQYNQHIESLQEEMDESTKSAKEIRGEIQSFRSKFAFVKAQDKCSSCLYPLLTRGFYLFPCQHRFHSDCLITEVLPNLLPKKRLRVEELQRKIASKERGSPVQPLVTDATSLTLPDQSLKEELDDLVATECIYCGDIMVRTIDRPFVEEDEYSQVMSSWT